MGERERNKEKEKTENERAEQQEELNKMQNRDLREHHGARKLKTEFKVCQI